MMLNELAVRLAATSSRRVRPMRRSLFLPCQVVRERDFRLVGRHALDVSLEGMLVATDQTILTGEPLIVSFRTPFGDTWIAAEASVVRVVQGRRAGDRGRALGLAFDCIDSSNRSVLEAQLRWFRPTREHGGPRRARALA